MVLSHRFFALGRSFEARVRPLDEGADALWIADVFEGETQKSFGLPLVNGLGSMPDEQRAEVLARLEGVIESQCRRGVILP